MINVKFEEFEVLIMGLRCLSCSKGRFRQRQVPASGKFQKFSIIYWNIHHCMIVSNLPTTHILSPHSAPLNLLPITTFDLLARMNPTEDRSVRLIP